MLRFSFSSVCSGMMALAALAGSANTARAQTAWSASASVRIPAVLSIRTVSLPRLRDATAAPGSFELVHLVTTAANVDYVMTVIGLSDLESLERGGLRVSVQTPAGTFSPMGAGLSVTAARGHRGAGSVTEVVVRVDGAPRNARGRIAEQLKRILAFRASVDEPSGGATASERTPTTIE